MVSPRALLLGPEPRREHLYRYLLAAPALSAIVAGLYTVGVFDVQGGVVFVPGQAAIVGLVAATLVGLRGDGAVGAWALVYGALFGYSIDHYVFGSPHKPLAERLVSLVSLDGLMAIALMTLVLGGLAFAAGSLGTWLAQRVGQRTSG